MERGIKFSGDEATKEQLDWAVECFRRSNARHRSSQALFNVGDVLDKLGRKVEAAQAYTEALSIGTRSWDTYHKREMRAHRFLESQTRELSRIVLTLEPPDAEVRVDGKLVEASEPIFVDLANHRIEVRKVGFEAYTFDLLTSQTRDYPRQVRLIPLPSVIVHVDESDAEIFVQQKKVSLSPMREPIVLERDTRMVEVQVTKAGFQAAKQTVNLGPGPTRVTIKLVRKPTTVSVSVRDRSGADLTGASIKLDGVVVGTSPHRDPIPLDREGKHVVEVTMAGHQAQTQEVDVHLGDSVPLMFTLARASAFLSIKAHGPDGEIAGAAVTIDGLHVGYTPLSKVPIDKPGDYRVEATKEALRPGAMTVRLAADDDRGIDIPLTAVDRRLTIAAWTALGVAVAAGAVGGVAYVKQHRAADDFNSTGACGVNLTMRGGAACQDDYNTMQDARYWILGGFIGAGAAAITSAILFWQTRSDEVAPSRHAFGCAPASGATGLTCAARF